MQVLPQSPKFQTLVRKRANDIRTEIVYDRGVLLCMVWISAQDAVKLLMHQIRTPHPVTLNCPPTSASVIEKG
jgi:hypothetical protein